MCSNIGISLHAMKKQRFKGPLLSIMTRDSSVLESNYHVTEQEVSRNRQKWWTREQPSPAAFLVRRY